MLMKAFTPYPSFEKYGIQVCFRILSVLRSMSNNVDTGIPVLLLIFVNVSLQFFRRLETRTNSLFWFICNYSFKEI